jgi:DNA-binding GntR family transcriptional regulator
VSVVNHGIEPVTRGSMQQDVVEALRRAVVSGALRPGQKLVEHQLATDLGVSRAPLREALRQLTGEGLLVAVPHKGTSVVELTLKDIREIFKLRAALEPVAIEQLIELHDPAHLVDLRGIVAQIAAALPERDPLQVAALDMRFHERMCELSGMSRLVAAYRGLGYQLRSYFTAADYHYDDRDLVENHEELVRVIEAGVLEDALEAIRRHISVASEDVIRRWSEPSPAAEGEAR